MYMPCGSLYVVYICENNLYGISVSQSRHQTIQDIASRATTHNMSGKVAGAMTLWRSGSCNGGGRAAQKRRRPQLDFRYMEYLDAFS